MIQRQEKCEGSGESMGKTASSRTVKKAVHKMSAEPANNNGRRHDVQAVRLVKPSSRAKRGSPAEIIVLPDGYRPAESEPFMNERHKIYFRNKLIAWKEEIVRQNRETLHLLHEDSAQHADFADRATSETDRALELRARDRQRKLSATSGAKRCSARTRRPPACGGAASAAAQPSFPVAAPSLAAACCWPPPALS